MKRTKGSQSEVGMLYQYGVTALLAAKLTGNSQVADYNIYSSENSAGKFDDIVARIKLKDQDDWYLYLIQVKYKETKRLNVSDNLRGKRVEYFLSDYIHCFNDILTNPNLTCRHGVPDDNIRFNIFCDKGIQMPVFLRQECTFQLSVCKHTEKSEVVNNVLLPFGNKYWKFDCEDLGKSEFQHFFDKCILYLEQPNYNKLNKLLEEACQIKNTKEIINYVKDYFNNDYLYKQGLSKEVFEIELQKIRLLDAIVPPTSFEDLTGDNLVAIWNEITIKHDITLVNSMQNFAIEPCLYSCLVQKINTLLDINIDWKTCISQTVFLSNEVIKKFLTYSKTKRVRYWIDAPSTLRLLIIEMWKCGDLPLILRTHTALSNFERYAQLKRSYIILDDWTNRSEEINRSKMNIFTSLTSIANPELQGRLLEDIIVSPQGRKPVTLKSLLRHDEELMSTFTCVDILRMMRKRMPFLKERYFKGSDYLAFIIEDDECAEISERIEPYAIGHNVRISYPPGQLDKCIKMIREHTDISQHYTIYHLRKTGEKLILTQGDPQRIIHRFVDQYGDPVFISNTSECIPIIGQAVEFNEVEYIARQLKRVTLPRSFFSAQETQICLLSGDLDSIGSCIEFSSVHDVMNETISKDKKTYFVKINETEKCQYWRRLCCLQYPLFDIYIRDDKLELLRYKNCKNLNFHISYDGGIYSEQQFFNEIRVDSEEIAVITGDAGIGKSSFLKWLCNNYSSQDYIIFYDLTNLQVDLNKSERQRIDLIDFIFKETQKDLPKQYTNFASTLRRKKKLIWILDSFDEIRLACEKQLLDFIRIIANSGGKIVIATRIENCKILMDQFDIRLMKIEPLEEKDCLSYWDLDQELLKNVSTELSTNPLYLNFLKMISVNREELKNITKYTLFEKVIHMKIKRCLWNTYQILQDSDIERTIVLFERLALVAMFGKELVEEELYWVCDKEVFDMTKFGIVIRFDEGTYPIFYHRSFVDFLFAQWIAKACQINIYKSAARYLYKQIFSENKLHVLNILFEDQELHSSILQKNMTKLKEIIKENSGCWNIVDKLGRTALHAAVNNCFSSNSLFTALEMLDIVTTSMMESSAKMDTPDIIMSWNWSEYIPPEIFDIICGFEKKEVVRTFLRLHRKKIEEYGCSSEVFPTKHFYSIFIWALQFGAIEMISDLVLLQNFDRKVFYNFYQGCLGKIPETDALRDKSFEFEGRLTPLHIACINGSVSMLQHLVNIGVDVDAVDVFGCTPSHYCIMRCCLLNGKSENFGAVKLLLKAGANPNSYQLSDNGISLLCLATRAMDINVVRLLLEKGANTGYCCKNGDTALHLAVTLGSMNIVQCLLRYGAQPSQKNQQNEMAADIAVKQNNTKMITLLNEYVADTREEEERAWHVYRNNFRANTTILHEAVEHGDVGIISVLLRKLGGVNAQNNSGCTPLHTALHENNVGVIEFLMSQGADVNISNKRGNTPLLLAALNNNISIIEMILERGAKVNIANIFGQTPLFHAAKNDNLDVVKLLLKKGANVNAHYPCCSTPLHAAISNGNEDIVSLLLDSGANPDIRNDVCGTCLHMSVLRRHKKITELLLRNGANPNVRCKQNTTPLILSVLSEDMELIKLLVEWGANLNDENLSGYTPLFYAVEKGDEDAVKFLLEKGANVHNKSGESVLFLAAKLELIDIVTILLEANVNIDPKGGTVALGLYAYSGDMNNVKLLLSKGVSVNASYNDIGLTALHRATNSHVDMVALLIENGAVINANSGKCFTPLYHAIVNKKIDIVKLLIDKGANINAKYVDGTTILGAAISADDISIVELLLEANVDINPGVSLIKRAVYTGNINIVKLLLHKGVDVYDGNDYTPLYTAICEDRIDIVKLLVEHGADVNSNSQNGYIPFLRASQAGQTDIASFLLDKGADINITYGDWTALRIKICQNDVDFVKFLIEKGADINIKTGDGLHLVQIAADCGYTTIVDVLLEAGADSSPQASNGNNFLRLAAYRGDGMLVKMLLHYGADIITDKATGTALLHDCAREGKVNIMEALVQEKIDLNIQDKMGNTAFHVSVTEEKVNVVKLLLSSNADADIVNINGKTIFEIVVDKLCRDAGGSKSDDENIQILSLILENMKKININDEAVTTSFYWAVQKGHSKIIESFLRHGVNVNVQNSIGYTPLHVAASNNNEKIVEILLENGADICLKTKDGLTPPRLAKLKGYTNLSVKFLAQNYS